MKDMVRSAKGAGRGDETLLMVGTKKGAFLFRSKDNRRTWKTYGPFFRGLQVYHMTYDRRNGALLAAVDSPQWGPVISISHDMGRTWKNSEKAPRFPKGSDLTVKNVWHVEPGLEDRPGEIFLGVEPACLFVSSDSGETWEVDQGMMNHSTRKNWQPGNGGLCLHTILVDERDHRRLHAGISSVGTLYSGNSGGSWSFRNKHVLADFFPGARKYPVYGQCVHKIVRKIGHPDTLFQQNHCGVFRSDDNGADWVNITSNLPSRFGFPIAVEKEKASRVFVAPLEGDFSRIPKDGRFSVWASDDDGREWFALNRGIPKFSYYDVLREAMKTDDSDPCGVYFGTTTGQLYASRNRGESWSCVSDGLPPVFSVEAMSA